MKAKVWRLAKIAVGWAFLVLGVLGLFLPVLQGVLFIAIGLGILATEQEWAHTLLHRLRRRFPRFAEAFDRGRHTAESWLRRIAGRDHAP